MTHKNLKLLNPSQREAVTYKDAPLLIVAGAGSGKTRVLTHRIAYLVESGVNPYNILALTFTNKAAGEMRSRVVSLVPGVSYTSFWLGTFHGICLRILKAESKLLGSFKNFIIYDGTDQIALIKECVKNLNLDEKKYKAGIRYFHFFLVRLVRCSKSLYSYTILSVLISVIRGISVLFWIMLSLCSLSVV